ncbi:MAG: hypothetical protein EOP23_22740, partial [Hyphomicrobiales bacterium]
MSGSNSLRKALWIGGGGGIILVSRLNSFPRGHPLSGNQASFDHVTDLARAWRFEHGTSQSDTAAGMRSHLLASLPKADIGMVERIVSYQSKVGHGLVPTPRGRLQGRGQHPARPCKYWATREGRAQVAISVDIALAEAHCADLPEPSIRAVRASIKPQVSFGAVRSALETIRPAPLVLAARTGLTRTAKDLIGIIEAEYPIGAVCYTGDADFLRKLYVPSANASTRRSQRRRLAIALKELQTTRNLGVNVVHHDGGVWIGRRCALPKNFYSFAKENPVRLVRLSDGLIGGRQGDWASDEGRMARAMIECIVDERHMDPDLAALTGATSTAELDHAEDDATYKYDRVADRTLPGYARNQLRLTAQRKRGWIAARKRHQDETIARLFEIHHEGGFPALWAAAREMPGLQGRMHDPASRRRFARLAKRMPLIVGERRCDQRFAYEMVLY